MKKQTSKKKLALQRETLADLQRATGGGVDTSLINNTVYYPKKSDGCGSVVIA